MAEYIDREEALKFIEECMSTVAETSCNENSESERKSRNIYLLAKDHAKQWVSFVPVADVAEVKHGEWITSTNASKSLMCSLCRAVGNGNDYCGHCGAKNGRKGESQ